MQAATWKVHTGIECDGIVAPTMGEVVAPNAKVTCSVTTPTDLDERIAETTTYPEDTFKEKDAFTWKATDAADEPTGKFRGGNTGQEVTWIAPKTPGTVTISVLVCDDAVIPRGDDGSREDSRTKFEVVVTVGEGGGTRDAGDVSWMKHTPITNLGTMPWNGGYFACGSEVELTVDMATDQDQKSTERPPPLPPLTTYPLDTFDFKLRDDDPWNAYTWTCDAGSFDDPDPNGNADVREPIWIAPETPNLEVSFEVTIKDDAVMGEGDGGTRDDDDVDWEASCTTWEVASVDWDEFTSALDANPNPGDGKRMYVGNTTPTDETARNVVYVKATITPAVPNKTVYFKLVDPDDPWTNEAPIDANGTAGNDNRGTGAALSSTSATTGQGGVAVVILTVTMQPGDNFEVHAANSVARLDIQDRYKHTELLTVWRKLHVEVDSMTTVSGNSVSGNITGVLNMPPWYADTDQNLLDYDMYEKGVLVKGGENYNVRDADDGVANTAGPDATVIITNADPGEGAFTSLTDDDTRTMPHYPDLGKMNSIFDDCYITCVDDLAKENDVAFTLNVNNTAAAIHNACSRDSSGYEADKFWVVYALGGYQDGLAAHDNDPDSETCYYGLTETDDFQESVTFFEAIGDGAAEHAHNATTLEQQTVVHEVGHQVLETGNGAHTANTIMQATLPVDAQYEKFSDAHIATIRAKSSSPGT